MPNPAYTRNQMCFPVLETAFGTAVPPVGTDCMLIISLVTQGTQPEIPRPDKTGSLGEIIGIPGRKSATWSASWSFAASAAATDCDVMLHAAFGKAVATSIYALDDLNFSMSIWNYNDPSTVCQYVAFGAVVNQAKFSFGGDVPIIEMSGPALWALDTDQLADPLMDTVGKGGLTTWTPRPTPTVSGVAPPGFVGQIILDGQTYGTLRTGSVTMALDRTLPMDTFNSYYGVAPAPGLRTITTDFGLYDDDDAKLTALRQKAFNKTPVNLAFQIGTVTGNKWTFALKNVLLPAPVVDYSSTRRALSFTGAHAHDTTIGAKDALTLTLS